MLMIDIDNIEFVPNPEGTEEAMQAFSSFINALYVISPEQMRRLGDDLVRQRVLVDTGKFRPSIRLATEEERAQYSTDSLVETAGEKAMPLAPARGLWKHI